jgi:hypothetical protein
MRRVSLVVVLSTLTLITVGAKAQQAEQPPQNPEQGNPFAMWDVQKMIDRATSQVVKRYALTPEQETFTRNLMATGVNNFLDKNEGPIRDIFAQAIKYQISGSPPPPEKVKEWTAQITPMFDEAKGMIVAGNRDFREILSDDQKKIHDIDLKIMEKNFTDAEQRLDRWREGDFNPERDFGSNNKKDRKAAAQRAPVAPAAPPAAVETQAPEAVTETPPAPPAPAAPQPAAPSRAVSPGYASTDRTADLWEMYVRRFIQNYQLDQSQSNLAMQILEETKKRANEYLASRKDEYQKLQTQLASAAGDQAASGEILKQIGELNKPVQEDLFNEMKQRLDQIPTEAQRKAYDAAHPKKATASAPASRPVASRPTATRPASLRPAANRPTTSRPALRRMAPTTRPSAVGQPTTAAPAPAAARPTASN